MIRLQPVLLRWPSLLAPRAMSLTTKSSVVNFKPADEENAAALSGTPVTSEVQLQTKNTQKSKLIAEVFANLNETTDKTSLGESLLTQLEKRIAEAKNVQELLHIAASPNLSRKMALNILSSLGDWTAEKKIKLSDFESDPRFLKMCRVLSHDLRNNNGLGDLATVLGVTGDDEAAKLISSASLSQMVRILEKLSCKKKRSPPLLRSLAFNISKSDDKLNIKQCADVLFAMANLSFHDEILLVKTCSDASSNITETTKSSVVASVARSLGILRYRDTVLLNRMAEWLDMPTVQARPQDVVAILMALAAVNHQPSNAETLFKKLIPILRPLDLPSSEVYLDAVWSLLLLDKIKSEHANIVLSSDFINKLCIEDGPQLSVSNTLKLLNINAATQSLLTNYQGPRLKEDQIQKVPLARSRDKTALVNCVMDTFLNLLPGENFLRRDIDSGAGFLIDGECVVDSKCTPLSVVNPPNSKANRIAIMVLGYHDTCVGARFHPNGVQAFSRRLLEARGFKVLSILHSEFNPASKLLQRVQYLEQHLKELVSN